MKIKSFKVKDFSEDTNKCPVDVPTGSIYRDMKIFHDGIYAFFEVPELTLNSTQRHTYVFITKDESVPENSTFITILDAIVEIPAKEGEPPQQAIQIIPIYKLN